MGRWKRKPGSKNKKPKIEERSEGLRSWPELTMENALFDLYYKVNIITEDEWEEFMNTMKRELPTTFRITGSRNHAFELRDQMVAEFFKDLQINTEEEDIQAPTPIPWYPNDLGWFYKVTRNKIKQSPEFSRFHKFLVTETDIGNISRQEAVSMIPPLLMNIQSNHYILDMCAAPGSKTTQLIEALHNTNNQSVLPEGVVIANDSDSKRSYMLVHQAKRLQSPCLIVTNHDASQFPKMVSPTQATESVLFDRILCDVPCTGDGTIRKNKPILAKWNPNQAIGLHRLQVRLLRRGCQLLKKRGRLVYSTCSLNPLENEAVVSYVLSEFKDQIHLVDVSKELFRLKRRPGLKTWKVMDKKGNFYDSYVQVEDSDLKKQLRESMFPLDNIEEYHIDRCLRIYPHLQDTGGFFVAVIEKTADDIPESDPSDDLVIEHQQPTEKEEPFVEEEITEEKKITFKEIRKATVRVVHQEPFSFLSENSPDIQDIIQHYEIQSFPFDQFLCRSEKAVNRSIYFISPGVKRILTTLNRDRLRVVSVGVHALTRNENKDPEYCSFRFHQEFLPFIIPFMSKQFILQISLKDLEVILSEEYPFFEQFSEQTSQKLKELGRGGGCVFEFDPKQQGGTKFQFPIILSIWRAKKSVNLLLPKTEKQSLLSRFRSCLT